MEKNFIIGEINFITKNKNIIQITESLKEGLTLWTVRPTEGLRKQLEENEDIKEGLKVAVTFTDETKKEIEKLTYLKAN